MKKLFFVNVAIFLFSLGAIAQQANLILQSNSADYSVVRHSSAEEAQAKSATTSVTDTLDYFFNKHYYRNATTPASAPANLQFSTLKSPYPSTSLIIGHCGSVFLNSNNITVNGLKGLVIRQATSPSQSVTVKLYICNVGLTYLPIMPPIDSVITSVASTTSGVWAGGSFTTPVNVSGNFAVLFKCGSTVPGDTIRLFINNAHTSAATAVPLAQRYGEGLSLIRFNGNFQTTTGAFSGSTGNDYEFVVAPYVSFNMTAAGAAVTSSICNYTNGSFNNTSTPMNLLENRQFNFNKFKPYWMPVNSLAPTTDSIYNWTFTGSTTGPTTVKNPTAFFNTLGIQSANITTKYRRSRGTGGASLTDLGSASIDVNNGAAGNINVSGTTTFCANSAISTTLFCTGSSSNSYTWTAPVSSVSPIVVITQSLGTMVYTVMAQSAGCTAIKEITVRVSSIPNVSLTIAKSLVCSAISGGSSVSLTGSPSGGTFYGSNVSGSAFNPPSYTGTFNPVYSYTNLTSGCSNSVSASIVVLNCAGVNQVALNQHVTVYPNPSVNGTAFIKNLEGTNKIVVYNLLGSVVLKQTSNQQELELDLSSFADGNYFVKIIDANGGTKTLKIVNQN